MDLQTVESLYAAFTVHQDAPRNFDEAMSEPFFTNTYNAYTAWINARAEYITTPVRTAAPVTQCCACRRVTADLSPIPDDILEAVEEHAGWGNVDEADETCTCAGYCEDCLSDWQAKYGAREDVYHIFDRLTHR